MDKKKKLIILYYQRFIGKCINKEDKQKILKYKTIEEIPLRETLNIKIIEKLCDYIDVFGTKVSNLFVIEPDKEAILALYYFMMEFENDLNLLRVKNIHYITNGLLTYISKYKEDIIPYDCVQAVIEKKINIDSNEFLVFIKEYIGKLDREKRDVIHRLICTFELIDNDKQMRKNAKSISKVFSSVLFYTKDIQRTWETKMIDKILFKIIDRYQDIFDEYVVSSKESNMNDLPYLTESDWEFLSKNSKSLKFSAGDIIFKEGELLQNLFRIVSGKIDVKKKGESQYKLITLDFFGEYSFFSKFSSLEMVALEDTELISLEIEDILKFFYLDPNLSLRFFIFLARELAFRYTLFFSESKKSKINSFFEKGHKKGEISLENNKLTVLQEFQCKISDHNNNTGTLYFTEEQIIHIHQKMGIEWKETVDGSKITLVEKLWNENSHPVSSYYEVFVVYDIEGSLPQKLRLFFEDILDANTAAEVLTQYPVILNESEKKLRRSSVSSTQLVSKVTRAIAIEPHHKLAEDQLSLERFDFLIITGKRDDQYHGRCNGKEGYFPKKTVIKLGQNIKSNRLPSSFEWEKIIEKSKILHFKKNDIIKLSESKIKNCVYIIQKGVVLTTRNTSSYYLADGDIFGEISFVLGFDEEEDVFKVISHEAEVIRIDSRRLINLFHNDPKLGSKFFMFLCFSIKKTLRHSGKVARDTLKDEMLKPPNVFIKNNEFD
eukprot:TRINITY_DN5435_c0_g1_i1.p1 TRINITY_DN5435_c0_g1~~TRINITY_DN5435_c0_g1_i1.p1  ORF type:complete len:719 (-),score=191.96 TRINITY_DN5435_c0_g1_i1:94-2250(-)